MSDDSYKKDKEKPTKKGTRKEHPLNSFRIHKHQKGYGCRCDNSLDPNDEMCCSNMPPPMVDDLTVRSTGEVLNQNILNDVLIHPDPTAGNKLCQRGMKEFTRVARPRKKGR